MCIRDREDILNSAKLFFGKFEQAFTSSDKKTYKENLTPFFANNGEEIKMHVKEPYPKYEEKKPDQWNEVMVFMKDYTFVNVLRHNLNAKIMDSSNILSPQFNGLGQIVEFERVNGDRKVRVGLCNPNENNWVMVYFNDKP
eukprot:TRINITY_DN7057_c0_g1_i7.p2 TRINITY_DN7057_c0_g1~~TRINITY_DN7057_c0_g1_i7.p2  ORF type:complete len:161 (+),score=51.30 TRINITY_DN7057_c0_g1_i7:63-485(+)